MIKEGGWYVVCGSRRQSMRSSLASGSCFTFPSSDAIDTVNAVKIYTKRAISTRVSEGLVEVVDDGKKRGMQ